MGKNGPAIFVGGLLLSLAIPCFPGLAQDQKPLPPSPYYPLEVGNAWYYRDGKETMVVRVTAHEKVKEELCARVEATEKGVKKTEYLAVRPDGLYRTKIKDAVLNPPMCVLKLPPKKDETWKVDSDIEGVRIKGTFSLTEEEVIVPAGKFMAFRASSKDLVLGNRPLSVSYWFVEKVGIVKQSLQISNVEVNLELEKFEPAR